MVSGSGAFNAPERDVSVISIPGRNGDLIIDNGRYKNIKVEYPGFIAKNFQQNARGARSWLTSPLGYKRLEDDYNPDEFRLARFIDGLEFEMLGENEAGETTVTFDCLPQRFLKSGEEENTISGENGPVYGNPIVIPDGADNLPVKNLIATLEPIQNGTGDPSPSNIRSISGLAGCTIRRAGKNLLSDTEIVQAVNNYYIGGNSTEFPHYLKAGIYTMSHGGGANSYLYWRLEGEGSDANHLIHHNDKQFGTFELPQDGYYRFWFYKLNTTASDFYDIQLELGTEVTDYEQCTNQEYTVDWASEAGIIYGGTLDVTTGVLTVDRVVIDLADLPGGAGWWEQEQPNQVNCHWYTLHDVPAAVGFGTSICSHFTNTGNSVPFSADAVPGTYTDHRTLPNKYFAWGTLGQHLSDFTAFLQAQHNNGTPVTLCYKLATPVAYQLTPVEVKTLLGTNIFYSDADNLEITYKKIERINNPTSFDSLPLIKVIGSGSGSLTINGKEISFSQIDDYIMLDSDLKRAYKGDVSKNNVMTGDFPVLIPGDNLIQFSGGITSVIITPRWWIL